MMNVAQIKRGTEVRLADGREGIVRKVSKSGTLEIRCASGLVYSHADCVTVL